MLTQIFNFKLNINWKQASTKRGIVGLFIAVIGAIMLLNGASGESIAALLLLGKGISDTLKITQED